LPSKFPGYWPACWRKSIRLLQHFFRLRRVFVFLSNKGPITPFTGHITSPTLLLLFLLHFSILAKSIAEKNVSKMISFVSSGTFTKSVLFLLLLLLLLLAYCLISYILLTLIQTGVWRIWTQFVGRWSPTTTMQIHIDDVLGSYTVYSNLRWPTLLGCGISVVC